MLVSKVINLTSKFDSKFVKLFLNGQRAYFLWSGLAALSHPFASMMRFMDAYLLLAAVGATG